MYEHSHIQKRDSIHIEWIHYIWRMNVCDNDAIYSNWMGCECFNFCLLSFHFGSLKELLNHPIFFHSTDFFFSFPRLSRINMTKSSMLSWQKLFLKATYKQQKQQRQWQQKKLSNIIFHLRFGTVHPRAHHWMCPTHESNHCVVNVCLPICVCFVVAVQFFPSFFWLLHSHSLSPNRFDAQRFFCRRCYCCTFNVLNYDVLFQFIYRCCWSLLLHKTPRYQW